jgi:hypothetical protein
MSPRPPEPPTINPYPLNPFVENNDSDEDGDNEYDNDGYQSSSSISYMNMARRL